MWNTVVFFFISIIINYKLINLLIVFYLFLGVFVFCTYALVAFLSEIDVPFYSTPLFSVLFNKIFIKSIYLLSMYQNFFEFPQPTLFLNFNMKHMTTVIFLRFLFSLLSCSSDVSSWYCFPSQQSLEHVTSRVSGVSSE